MDKNDKSFTINKNELTQIENSQIMINGYKMPESTYEISSKIIQTQNAKKMKKQLTLKKDQNIIVQTKQGEIFEMEIESGQITFRYGTLCRLTQNFGIFPDHRSFLAADYRGLHLFQRRPFYYSYFLEKKNTENFVLSCNGKYIVITDSNDDIHFWSFRNKKFIKTFNTKTDHGIRSMTCTKDNKFIFLGHEFGYLSVLDIQKHKMVKSVKILRSHISSVVMSNCTNTAYYSDITGKIARIEWNSNITSENDLVFERIKNFGEWVYTLCITNDNKELLVGTSTGLYICSIDLNYDRKYIKLRFVYLLSLFNDDKKALLCSEESKLHIVDIETLEIIGHSCKNLYDTDIFKFVVI